MKKIIDGIKEKIKPKAKKEIDTEGDVPLPQENGVQDGKKVETGLSGLSDYDMEMLNLSAAQYNILVEILGELKKGG